MVTLDNDVTR